MIPARLAMVKSPPLVSLCVPSPTMRMSTEMERAMKVENAIPRCADGSVFPFAISPPRNKLKPKTCKNVEFL